MNTNRKGFIRLLVLLLIVTSIAFAAPNQTNAAWWNPFSWFSVDKETVEQKPQTAEVKNDSSTTTNTEIKEEQNKASAITIPQNNSSDAKTIQDLKAEITTLKASLDSLYKAHNDLVNDHNTLLEYTKSIATANKTIGSTINSALNTQVSDLEKRLNDVCAQIFSSVGSLSSNKCPSSQFQIKESLEFRIKKLEGGY